MIRLLQSHHVPQTIRLAVGLPTCIYGRKPFQGTIVSKGRFEVEVILSMTRVHEVHCDCRNLVVSTVVQMRSTMGRMGHPVSRYSLPRGDGFFRMTMVTMIMEDQHTKWTLR